MLKMLSNNLTASLNKAQEFKGIQKYPGAKIKFTVSDMRRLVGMKEKTTQDKENDQLIKTDPELTRKLE